MYSKPIGNCMDSEFNEELYIEKLRKLREKCSIEGIDFDGTLYDSANYILCYVNDGVDVLYKKDNHHVFLHFSFIASSNDEHKFSKLQEFVEKNNGIVKNKQYIPQCLHHLEVHILDKKFTEVIKESINVFGR